jgi:hypothetical protein
MASNFNRRDGVVDDDTAIIELQKKFQDTAKEKSQQLGNMEKQFKELGDKFQQRNDEDLMSLASGRGIGSFRVLGGIVGCYRHNRKRLL